MSGRRLRQVIDLYTTGQVAVLADGNPVWVRVLNPFEQDTARSEAQIAKARLTLAIKELGSGERDKVKMFFLEDGPVEAVRKLVDAKVGDAAPKIIDRLRIDPEWSERLTILERGLDDTARVPEPEERELLEKIAAEYQVEVGNRLLAERDYWETTYEAADDERLWTDYLEWYLDQRGYEVLHAEFRLYQTLYGTYHCDATRLGGDTWDHSRCTHEERFFEDANEVRTAPTELVQLLIETMIDVDMLAREAKNSRRQGSSSDSSPLPSEAAESTPSTPDETRAERPGSSF